MNLLVLEIPSADFYIELCVGNRSTWTILTYHDGVWSGQISVDESVPTDLFVIKILPDQ